MRAIVISLITLLTSATSVFAATGRTDHSGFLVWAFLGFCGLIVAAQLIPAALMLFGIVKGVASPREEAEQKTH